MACLGPEKAVFLREEFVFLVQDVLEQSLDKDEERLEIRHVARVNIDGPPAIVVYN